MGWRSKKKERKNAKKEYRLNEESNLKTRELIKTEGSSSSSLEARILQFKRKQKKLGTIEDKWRPKGRKKKRSTSPCIDIFLF